jgi:hypothetical protein
MFALEIGFRIGTEMIVTSASDSALFVNLPKRVISFNFEGRKCRRPSVLQPNKAGRTGVAPFPLSSCSSETSKQTPTMMAVSTPLSPGNRPDMKMPMPPPLLHTRSGNEMHDRPQTPNQNGFTSPMQTPIGSPSKKQLPPGANDLPNVFENAMKLAPTSPSKGEPKSPSKQGLSLADENITRDPFSDSVNHNAMHGSPTRKSNKENTAPGGYHLAKSPGIQQNQAAISRQEAYQQTESKKGPAQTRGLTAEELQKLQLPRVKRLANVTQLCKNLYSI